jgi:hypothetical protein
MFEVVKKTYTQIQDKLLYKNTNNSHPKQNIGYDCSLFDFATMCFILLRELLLTKLYLHRRMLPSFKKALYAILGSDINPGPDKLLSPNFVTFLSLT